MLDPLYTVISWLLLTYHRLLNTVLSPDSGANWALSIVLLVITIRLILFPLFVRQIKAQRRLQLIQPQMKALREKYKHDKQTLNLKTAELMRENNANPLSGCLPLLVQIPVFISLFHVLRWVSDSATNPDLEPEYGWTREQMASCAEAKLFGAPISAAFNTPVSVLNELNASQSTVRIVTGCFIVIMAVTTFLTQRQMLARQKAMGTSDQMDSPIQPQTVQRTLMYVIPISLVFSGPFFPLGVLIYWTTTNLFSLGQQQYVIRTMHEHEQRKREAEVVARQNPAVDVPKPGVKPVNPRKQPRADRPQQPSPGAGGQPKPQPGATGKGAASGGSSPPSSPPPRQGPKRGDGKPPKQQ